MNTTAFTASAVQDSATTFLVAAAAFRIAVEDPTAATTRRSSMRGDIIGIDQQWTGTTTDTPRIIRFGFGFEFIKHDARSGLFVVLNYFLFFPLLSFIFTHYK